MENEFDLYETILYPLTYDDLVLMAKNTNPARGYVAEVLRRDLKELLKSKAEECLELYDAHIDDIFAAAFPDEGLENHPDFPEERAEQLAREIYNFLLAHEMWIDTNIYYNGKCMSTCNADMTEFRYNGEPFIIEDKDPRKCFEYVAEEHILSMSFEGPFYEALNGYAGDYGWQVEDEFLDLLKKYGVYYELGNAWNLSLYPI